MFKKTVYGIVLVLLVILVFWPHLLGIRPTVPEPRRPVDDQSELVAVSLGEAWEPTDDVPWRLVLPLARISEATYQETSELKQTLNEWGLDKFDDHVHGTMYACVASNKDAIVVAFRGTDEIRDWLINVRVLSDRVTHGKIHRGFYRSMQAMRPRIEELILEHGGKEKPIWIVGHSLGGGLAVAFSYAVLTDGSFRPEGLVTFGQPLLVSSSVGKYLNEKFSGRYIRFVHEADFVARILPTYSHCGDLIWFHDGSFQYERNELLFGASGDEAAASTEEENLGPDPVSLREFRRLQGELRDEIREEQAMEAEGAYGGDTPWIADHGMAGYIHWILQFLEGETHDSGVILVPQ